MSNKLYDTLKWVALILLPALAVFWVAIATVWHLPYVQEIETTIIAVDTFLGALIGVSANKYNKRLSDEENPS